MEKLCWTPSPIEDANEEFPALSGSWADIVEQEERVEAAHVAAAPVASSSSEAPTIASPASDRCRVEQQIEAPADRPDSSAILHNSDIVYAVGLARAGQAEFITDSLRVTLGPSIRVMSCFRTYACCLACSERCFTGISF